MTAAALVVGGTGPTGPHIVQGLRGRGLEVAILHRGAHETPEIPPEVEHVHADPFDAGALEQALAGRRFDVVVATYGRLREIARVLAGRAGQLVGVGGVPVYRGWMRPEDCAPRGLPVPVAEDAPLVMGPEELRKGHAIRLTEEAVLAHHPRAAIFRYPYVYGPRQLLPREWCVVRRVLDGRPHVVLADGGLTLGSAGYAENLAHAVLLAVDRPEAAAGQVFNCGDERVLSARQLVEWIAHLMGHRFEIVSVPAEVALPAWPLLAHEESDHRVMDLSKLRSVLGYRDVVPTGEALRRTVDWLVAHPPEPGGPTERLLGDPFDYAGEDRLVEAARESLERLHAVRWDARPGAGASYIPAHHRGSKRGG